MTERDWSGVHRTAAGKWFLWSVATGERIERWPVDARGMIASGAFTLEPPPGGDVSAIEDLAGHAPVEPNAVGRGGVLLHREPLPPTPATEFPQ